MITARDFLYQALTFFAFLNIRCVLPSFNLLLKCSLTARSRMSLPSAFVAYLSAAFGAFCIFFVWISVYNDRTFWVRTPFEVGAFLYLQISQK